MKYLHVELKVCEGCGALWLRSETLEGVYCAPCARHLAGFPPSRPLHPGGRPRLTGAVSARTARRRRCNGGVQ